jgi:hypothetical protein
MRLCTVVFASNHLLPPSLSLLPPFLVCLSLGTQLSAVAQYAPFLKPQVIDCVLAVFVPPRDPFSMPFVDVIRESTRQ